MSNTTATLIGATVVVLLTLFFAGMDAIDTETWTRDGNCFIRIYDNSRWLWIDDHKTVETYCKAAGR